MKQKADSTSKGKKSSELSIPMDLKEALNSSKESDAAWNNLTPISQRDFVSWINEAKQEETRNRRIQRCIENLAKGKKRPCCYAVVPMDFYKAMGAIPKAKSNWSKLTANQKRDFSDWIEASDNKEIRKQRIKEACTAITSGKLSP